MDTQLLAIHGGILCASEIGLKIDVLESDVADIIKRITNRHISSSLGANILRSISYYFFILFYFIVEGTCRHIFRTGNMIAHTLANFVTLDVNDNFWMDSILALFHQFL